MYYRNKFHSCSGTGDPRLYDEWHKAYGTAHNVGSFMNRPREILAAPATASGQVPAGHFGVLWSSRLIVAVSAGEGRRSF